jgi:phosphoribosylformylglycinamidine synthase
VLGICNGFQVLVESHLLPGGLIRNDVQTFVCRDQKLIVENVDTPWTNGFTRNQEITIPLKNGEGGYIADAETLKRLEGEGLVAFRYKDVNPNGSLNDIVGLMPHPEHAVEPGFGPDTSVAMRSGLDGLTIFKSVLNSVVNA